MRVYMIREIGWQSYYLRPLRVWTRQHMATIWTDFKPAYEALARLRRLGAIVQIETYTLVKEE